MSDQLNAWLQLQEIYKSKQDEQCKGEEATKQGTEQVATEK